jgi:DNA polymerase-1
MTEEKKRLIIIDGNSVIHRAFHALPPLSTKKGEMVNAVYGFLLVFFKAIKEFHPDHIVAAFDLPFPTFRHEKFKEYKAKRPKAPKELYEQIPKVKEVLRVFKVPILEKQGFEADDIIGTISKKYSHDQKYPEREVIILSGDADVLQLVNKNTKAFILRRGVKDTVLYDEKLVKEKYQGLNPDQLDEYKALRGDPSDNIPGVKGIGEKTAISLIKKFNTLEELYSKLEKDKDVSQNIRLKLEEQKEQAFLSKELGQIRRDVPIDLNLENGSWQYYDQAEATTMLEEMEFYSLIPRLPGKEREDCHAEKFKQEKKPKKAEDKFNNNLRLW